MSEEQLYKSCQNIKTAPLFHSRLIMFIKDMFKSFSTPCSARIWYQSYKPAYIGIWVLHLVSFQMSYLLLMPSFIDSQMSQFAPFSLWTIIESYVFSHKVAQSERPILSVGSIFASFRRARSHRTLRAPRCTAFLEVDTVSGYCDPSIVFFLLYQMYGPWEKPNVQHI